ncbi:structural maintenance of chromosomes protein 6-like, partial [Tropilaelaps mercedesae]
MVGLGGKTGATNRGNRTAGFIQTGKSSARIEITLANRGTHAYKPDEFGPSITVTRTLRQTSAQYEIRSHDRRVVSTKHEDLQTILRHLNIQVDNPIVVLNQETSRNFLQSKSAKDKYQFFMKATQLEEVKENYRRATEDYQEATRNLRSKRELLDELNAQKTKYELQLKIAANIANECRKVERLEGELLWSAVSKHEALVREAARQVEKYDAQLTQLQSEIDRFVRGIRQAEDDSTGKTEQLEAISTEKVELTKDADAAKSALAELKQQFRNIESEQKRIKRDIRNLQGDRQALQNDISRPQESNEEWHREKARREKEIELTIVKLSKLREGVREAQATEAAARRELARTEDVVREQKETTMELEIRVQRQRHRINTAMATRKDAINRFGPATAQVLRDIANEKRFRVRPKGPVGALVSVKDENWAYAIERHCSSTLTGWMADNKEDCKLLKSILQRHGVSPITLYTRQLGRPRYQCAMVDTPGANSRCMASVVELKDDDVFNLLVDINRIHRVLLYNDLNMALADMKNRATVPNGCTQALDAEYNRIFPAPRYRYFANDRPLQVKYLRRSVDDVLPHLEQELEDLVGKEALAKKELALVTRAQVNAEKHVREAREVSRDIGRSLAKYEEKIQQLKDFEEPIPVDHAPLLSEITRIDRDIAARETQLTDIEQDLTAALNAIKPANEALREKDALVQAADSRVQRLRKELERLEQHIKESRSGLMNLESRSVETVALPVNSYYFVF